MTDTDGLLRDAGGPRKASDVDALIEQFPEINPGNYGEDDAIALNNWGIDAVAALVQLRDSEALARGKIAEQMIEIERLRGKRPAFGPEHVCPMCKGEKCIVHDSMGLDERMRCHFYGGTGVHRNRLTELERAEAEVARIRQMLDTVMELLTAARGTHD